jgi:phosphoglycerate dehydrogenase-like enzyme
MKAVLHYNAGPDLRRRVANPPDPALRIVVVPEADRGSFAREIRDAEVLLHVLEPMSAAMIEGGPQLRLIQKIGIGVNTIDRVAAAKRGILVANMPGTNTQAVAEHTLALMMAVLRRLVPLDRHTRAGKGWQIPPDELERSGEIAGRTIGFVGFGAVPQRLTPILAAMGAKILYTRRSPEPAPLGERRDLDALLAEADIVSLHAPLTEETRGLIDARRIALMKKGAILINTARGDIIDEDALVAALRDGRLAGAGLDVLRKEPAPAGQPIFGLENLVVSPHIAWLTPETIARSLTIAFENCRRLRAGETLLHLVPPPG